MLGNSFLKVLLILSASAVVGVSVTQADIVYDVSLDTSTLSSHVNSDGPFILDFEMNSPTGGSGTNQATISGLNLGSGSLTAGTVTSPVGAMTSGDLNAGDSLVITTNGTTFSDYFDQSFTPGSSLQFTVHLTTNVETPPDDFLFQIYSSSGSVLSALELDITGTNAVTVPVGGDVGGFLSDGTSVPAPGYSQLNAVPEPSSLTLFSLGLLGLVARRGRRFRREVGPSCSGNEYGRFHA